MKANLLQFLGPDSADRANWAQQIFIHHMLTSCLGIRAASLTGVTELSMFIHTALFSFLNVQWFLSAPLKHGPCNELWLLECGHNYCEFKTQHATFLASHLRLPGPRKYLVEEAGCICFGWEKFLLTCIRFCTLETSAYHS